MSCVQFGVEVHVNLKDWGAWPRPTRLPAWLASGSLKSNLARLCRDADHAAPPRTRL